MTEVKSMFSFFRKLCLLALTGFLVVMLAGPILALFGVLLSFAAIGLCVWLPVKALVLRKPMNWNNLKELTHKYTGAMVGGCQRLGTGVNQFGGVFVGNVQATGRYLATICREICCGTLVGGMLGILRGGGEAFPFPFMIIGLSGGAIVGALVGISSRLAIREPA